MPRILTISAFLAIIGVTFSSEQKDQEASECLKKCLTPMVQLDRSFTYVFNNFEKVCDMLEDGAFCARKCTQEDQRKFYQYTTFYRIHCVDYEEELQEHLSCIAKAAAEADLVCKDRCRNAHKVEKTASKESKMKSECLTLECSTVCYFEELAEECPEAKDVLLKTNIGQVHSMAQGIHPLSIEKMEPECRNLHDTDYMRQRLLAPAFDVISDTEKKMIEQSSKNF
ncbi:unnamed protein product [Caenorhabditis auriculariae]|uniref:Chondroitin proteoglycan 4 domain-containing protein n=1 Tax=Caenorhabditis auriculariae TaxID=2777116 RepID=A0A8S1GU99_9PELO|nr:unnamed protein product [Caenorhabditis auriculariae]